MSSPQGFWDGVIDSDEKITSATFCERIKKTKQKKTSVSRVSCASSLRSDRAETHPPSAASDSPRAYFRPHRRCSARDKGKYKTIPSKTVFQAPFKGAT
jgi:hypothetical protein